MQASLEKQNQDDIQQKQQDIPTSPNKAYSFYKVNIPVCPNEAYAVIKGGRNSNTESDPVYTSPNGAYSLHKTAKIPVCPNEAYSVITTGMKLSTSSKHVGSNVLRAQNKAYGSSLNEVDVSPNEAYSQCIGVSSEEPVYEEIK